MDQFFVEIEIYTRNGETEIFTSVPSFVALYVYRFLNSPANIQLVFVRAVLPDTAKLKLRSETFRRELTEEKILRKEAAGTRAIRDLRLPVYAKDGTTYIAGMCAVCRELVVRQPICDLRKLLGFKESCLLSPSESSMWTRFCEVNVVEALSQLIRKLTDGIEIEEVPQEVTRFERHMNEPVRMHNIYKLAREQAQREQVHNNEINGVRTKKNKILIESGLTPKEHLQIEHRFAEGVAFTIADLILYPCMRLIFQLCPGMLTHFPLTYTWITEIDAFDPSCLQVLKKLTIAPLHINSVHKPKLLKILDCQAGSLYKSDPKRYKPRNRIFTAQSEVDATLGKLQLLQLHFSSNTVITYNHTQVDWTTIEPTHEKSSALPPTRLLRKRQQLENVASAVYGMARPGDRIIDFCSGTGHLGLLIALQLPKCTVILMENKAISLERAKQRASELKLDNCRFYQCNIDYFEGQFDIGAALHACGTATDIVLQQCTRVRANFVCCPCCYGSLQPMPHISYPLSRRFRAVVGENAYLHIAHTADQAHELGTPNCKPETTRQGQLCMDIVDTDRKLQAEEAGYEVILTRLQPEQCTPKNRLLVGCCTRTS